MKVDFDAEVWELNAILEQLLRAQSSPAKVREAWDSPAGDSLRLWRKLAAIGLATLTADDEHGGGQGPAALAPLLETVGRYAAVGPLIETIGAGCPLLAREQPKSVAGQLLEEVAAGEAM